jgi:hypothetical protein
MILSLKICYIFEQSENLLELPIVPVSFNTALMVSHSEKFRRIEEEGAITEDEFWSGIDYDDRYQFHGLMDVDSGMATLNAIGVLMWEKAKDELPIELRKSVTSPRDKVRRLADHHGKSELEAFAKRLAMSEYVEAIEYSTSYVPHATKLVHRLIPKDRLQVVLTDTDAGYSMIVTTTARNSRELEAIAEIIQEKYGR